MVQKRSIPYGRQQVSEDDIAAVVATLRSDWLTQGPLVERFERAVAEKCSARYAVAVSSGTAALHLAVLAAGLKSGEEVVTSPLTFVASANCAAYVGARPVFADIDPRTYCVDAGTLGKKLTSATRCLIPVHFAGQPCDMPAIATLARQNNLVVIEDAAHALGATYQAGSENVRVGSCRHSDMTTFSFHPVKQITTAEGGLITTNSTELYQRLVMLRTHGITRDPALLLKNEGPWYYEQQMLGYNYRLSDVHSALGLSQLSRLDEFVARRRAIADAYNAAFSSHPQLQVPCQREGAESAWHLYVLGLNTLPRDEVFVRLRECGLGVNVHYIPVHLQPYFRQEYGCRPGDCPVAEACYGRILTLPLFPGMSDEDVDYVISSVLRVVGEMSR